MLKKVVVETQDELISFIGENLKVINKSDQIGALTEGASNLVIMDGSEVIAVFAEWNYWRKIY